MVCGQDHSLFLLFFLQTKQVYPLTFIGEFRVGGVSVIQTESSRKKTLRENLKFRMFIREEGEARLGRGRGTAAVQPEQQPWQTPRGAVDLQ